MCTSISLKTKDFYFGRNLDVEKSYGQQVVVTPRNYEFRFTNGETTNSHYAMIGMATVIDNYPLYAEATNEKGLSIAGLNFPGNAKYFDEFFTKKSISPFEFIPSLLSVCGSVSEVEKILSNCTIVNIAFKSNLPLTPLHWMISDDQKSITVESTSDGLMIYDNPIGVLTNNPKFDYHMSNLANYMNLSTSNPDSDFAKQISKGNYGVGMGAIGLPGDLSPASRFVRAAFTKLTSKCNNDELSSVSQFFHILDSVAMTKGTVQISNDIYDITLYSCCINTSKGIYYYKNYFNSEIIAVNMFNEDLTSNNLITYDWRTNQSVTSEN